MRKNTINYSQCWEDPRILLEALSIQKEDTVLSITSGGDNSLALLSKGPKSVVSVDLNSAQNYLLELKRSAARKLEYDEYLAFVGVKESDSRIDLFHKVRTDLSPEADEWWSEHLDLISRGIIHSGRFERFTAFFARNVLPYIHSKKTIKALLSFYNVAEQAKFYRTRWNSIFWRFLFGVAASKLLLGRARQRAMFAYAQVENVAVVYRERLEKHLTTRPIRSNFFLQYSLTGNYVDALPPYLEKNAYTAIRKAQAENLHIVSSDLLSYLRILPEKAISKYNLSDIFEALSLEQHEALWGEIIRTAKSGARVVYWTNLVPRSFPTNVAPMIKDESVIARKLQSTDRVFFYGGFHVHTILK